MKYIFRTTFILLILLLFNCTSQSQCNQNYNWTTWNNFTANTATGTVLYNSQPINVSMSSNFNIFSTVGIYNYAAFSGASSVPPNATVPATTWAIGPGGVTTMCFSQQVSNPVLLLSSVGNNGNPVTLKFSRPYSVVYDGGANTFLNDTTLIGAEGYSIIKFPGNFNCVTIYSSTPENYTNITWGLNPPLFPVTITENYNVCGTASYTASGGLTYQWSGGSTPNLATNSFNTSGTYFLTVTDQNGCEVNTSQQVIINPSSSIVFSQDTIHHCGSSYTLDAGNGFNTYQWNTGETSQTINATTPGMYIVTVTTAAGCITMDSCYLDFLNTNILNNNTTICLGASVNLNATGGTYFNWSPALGLSNPNIANPIATPQTTTTYYLTSQFPIRNLISNSGFESGNTGFNSSYNPANVNQFVGEYTVTNSPNNWNPGFDNCTDHTNGSGNMLLINGATIPNVTVYCQTVNVEPNTNYAFSTWLSSMNTTNPALLQFSINGINLGNIFQASYNSCEWNQFYSIWNSGNNTSVDICIVNQNTNAAGNDFALDDIGFYELCTSVDSVKISVIPTTQSFSQVVCDSLRWHGTLYNTTGAYTYSFVNANGCISTDTLHLTVNTSTYRVENQMACRNFIWHNVNYTSSGTYLYRYNNGFGCPSVDTLHLAINARPNLGQDVTRKICYGSTFDLTSLFSLSGLQSNWTFNGNLVNNPALAYMNGIYQLVVTDISGCNDTAKVNLAINPPVIANAGNDTVVQLNTSFQLHGSGGSTYLWSPSGVLNNSNVASPLATISNSTQFVLIVFDNLGCSDSDSILVRAISGPQIYVPNSFTPNGDGLNDIFKPIYVGIYKINYFSIFNRYGEKIFETSSINIGWDGKFKGSNQPMTNYIWIVSGKDKNNNPVQKKGNVLLIR